MEDEAVIEGPVDAFLTSTAVAHLAAVTPECVRAWERRGLLSAQRTTTGIRLFRRHEVLALLADRARQREERMTQAK